MPAPAELTGRAQNYLFRSEVWAEMLKLQLGRRDVIAVKCLRVVGAGLDMLRAVRPELAEASTPDAPPGAWAEHFSSSHRALLERLPWMYFDPQVIVELGLMYLYDVRLPLVAQKHFELAVSMGSKNPDVIDLAAKAAAVAKRANEGPTLTHSSIQEPEHDKPSIARLLTKSGKLILPHGAVPTATDFYDDRAASNCELLAGTENAGAKLLRLAQDYLKEESLEAATTAGRYAIRDRADRDELFALWTSIAQAFYEKRETAKAILAYEQTTQLLPEAMEGWFNLGTALYRAGRFFEAQLCFEAAAKLHPGHAKVLCNVGACHFQMDRFEEAEKALREAVESDPLYVRAWHNLGTVLGAQSQLGPAIDAFQQALALRPGGHESLVKLGMIYYHRDELAEAESSLREVLGTKPWSAHAGHYLAMIHARTERLEDAIQLARDAYDEDPRNEIGWMAYNEIGLAFINRGDFDSAIAILERASELDRQQFRVFVNLGVAYFLRQQMSEARSAFELAVSLNPELGNAWHSLGLVHSQLGEYEQATRAFQQAIDLQPDNPRGWYDLGVSLQKDYRYEESREALSKAMLLSQTGKLPNISVESAKMAGQVAVTAG